MPMNMAGVACRGGVRTGSALVGQRDHLNLCNLPMLLVLSHTPAQASTFPGCRAAGVSSPAPATSLHIQNEGIFCQLASSCTALPDNHVVYRVGGVETTVLKVALQIPCAVCVEAGWLISKSSGVDPFSAHRGPNKPESAGNPE